MRVSSNELFSTLKNIPRFWRNWTVLEFVTRKRLGSSLTCSIALSAPGWNARNRSHNQYLQEFLKGPFSARCSLSYFCGIFRLSLVAALFFADDTLMFDLCNGKTSSPCCRIPADLDSVENGRSTGLRHSTLASLRSWTSEVTESTNWHLRPCKLSNRHPWELIPIAEKTRHLGVILTDWSSHVRDILKRVGYKAFILKRLAYRCRADGFVRHMFMTVVRPILEYASPVWDSCTKADTCIRTTSTVRGQSNSEEGTASGIKLCGPGNDWVANTGLEKTTFEVSPAVETCAWSWATSSAGTAANPCFCTRQAVLA